MTAPILPTASSIVTPAIDAIVALRPEALAHFNNVSSRWSDLPAMWRAQLLLNLARLGDEIQSARLRFATGDALRTLCASEFNTTLPSEPQTAAGVFLVSRPGAGPAGVIKAGTLFSKTSQPNGIALPAANAYPIAIAAASYQSIGAVYSTAAPTQLAVTCAATLPGVAGNLPTFLNTGYRGMNQIQPSAPLFDPTYTVFGAFPAANPAGGSSGLSDPVLVAAARAYYVGQFGPTDGAVLAGLLRQQSVRHVALFRASGSSAYAFGYIADESWASNPYWVGQVAQSFVTNFQGFGCRVRLGTVFNLAITMSATIELASTDDLNNTDDIDANVRAAARSYFDDRPDWYRWHTRSLQAALGAADPRILQCTGVTVTDSATGAAVGEPSIPSIFNNSITHYYLAENSVNASYLPPS